MVTHHRIEFIDNLPSIDEVVKSIRKNSGLSVYYNVEKFTLFSTEYSGTVYFYEDYENGFLITTTSLEINYLIGTTIYSLIELGGEIDAVLPIWISQPWNLIKDSFELLPHEIWYNEA